VIQDMNGDKFFVLPAYPMLC